jgi:hypothetical protein
VACPLLLQLLHAESYVLLKLELLFLIFHPFRILDVILSGIQNVYHVVDIGLLVDLITQGLVQVFLVIYLLTICQLDIVGVRIKALLFGLLFSKAASLVA